MLYLHIKLKTVEGKKTNVFAHNSSQHWFHIYSISVRIKSLSSELAVKPDDHHLTQNAWKKNHMGMSQLFSVVSGTA